MSDATVLNLVLFLPVIGMVLLAACRSDNAVRHLTFWVMVIQFVLTLLSDTPNIRLVSFGRSMGSYLRQIVNFLTFATEEMPFPFSEWPAGE